MTALDRLLQQFQNILGVRWSPPEDLRAAALAAIQACGPRTALDAGLRRKRLLALVNAKFGFNQQRVQVFLDAAATCGAFLNYHDKLEVSEAFDGNDVERMERWLRSHTLSAELSRFYEPIEPRETLSRLAGQLEKPEIRRRDARECGPGERRESVLRSLFGSFVFHCFPAQRMHSHFNADCGTQYFPDFYDHLQHFHAKVLQRDRALAFLVIDDNLRSALGRSWRDRLYQWLEEAYVALSNHCYLAILVEPFREDDENGQWRLYSDLLLYAEKHRETPLRLGYFRPEEIAGMTAGHGVPIDPAASRFELANEGFCFRDCIVLPNRSGPIATTSTPCSLLLLLEKNERDETVVPCPACRSTSVRGNSYPVLGVKSWECQQPLCPERSAFDRGHRYSLAALVKRRAIVSDADQIPKDSLLRWKLDIVPGIDIAGVADMLLRHFSVHGDTVEFVNTGSLPHAKLGRNIQYADLTLTEDGASRYDRFQQSALFSRFVLDKPAPPTPRRTAAVPSDTEGVHVYQGDAFEILASIGSETIDGAVTSPPYYNARSYSVWPNIYCYLYDMYNVAAQVYRVLRPGAYYLFNIFDSFDNERSIALSAMGKKRLILGAYLINLLRRVGFRIEANTVWYKGEVEGKRNFNQGNRSPYYQLPLNCWEHVLIFRKPGAADGIKLFPTILAARPVVKIVKGRNVLGHSAPFPAAIPELLIGQMSPGTCVLDPFSGSMTTGRTAYRYGLRSVSVDLHREYCDLGLSLLRQDGPQRSDSRST